MCGRYGLTIDQEALSIAYGVDAFLTEHQPRYNIAPSQNVPVLVDDEHGRRVEGFRWGLVPAMAGDPRIGYRAINARSETVSVRPAFRDAWRERRRCLVLADGFFEWQQPPSAVGPKIPHWIHMADRRPFGFAGLWERWEGEGKELFTCTVLTTTPNTLVEAIHDRMPAILGDESVWNEWLDGRIRSDDLRGALAPYPPEEMHAYAATTYVNHAANEGPECIAPAEEVPEVVLRLDL